MHLHLSPLLLLFTLFEAPTPYPALEFIPRLIAQVRFKGLKHFLSQINLTLAISQ